MTATTHPPHPDPHLTDEGGQEMRPRSVEGGVEVLRELGSVLRMSEAEAADLGNASPTRPRPRSSTWGPSTRAPTACCG